MSKEIGEINNEILRVTQSVVVHTPNYSKFGGYEGERDIYTMDIATALYKKGYRKQSELVRGILREVRQALLNMVLANSMGENYDIEKRFAEIEKKYTGGD